MEGSRKPISMAIPIKSFLKPLPLPSGTGVINHTFKEYRPYVSSINRNRKNGALISMSQGRAQFTMQFDHYEQVPQAVADEVIAKMA